MSWVLIKSAKIFPQGRTCSGWPSPLTNLKALNKNCRLRVKMMCLKIMMTIPQKSISLRFYPRLRRLLNVTLATLQSSRQRVCRSHLSSQLLPKKNPWETSLMREKPNLRNLSSSTRYRTPNTWKLLLKTLRKSPRLRRLLKPLKLNLSLKNRSIWTSPKIPMTNPLSLQISLKRRRLPESRRTQLLT